MNTEILDKIIESYEKSEYLTNDAIKEIKELKTEIESHYFIKRLPFGWCIENLNIVFCDMTSKECDDVLKVKFEDNGVAFYPLIKTNKNGKYLAFDSDAINDLTQIILQFNKLLDESSTKALKECMDVWYEN